MSKDTKHIPVQHGEETLFEVEVLGDDREPTPRELDELENTYGREA